MTQNKLPLDALITLMEPEHARVCREICEEYSTIIYKIPGSNTKHQAWEGGFISHVEEAMNIGLNLFEMLDERRKLDMAKSDVLFCIFLHDFDKLLRYKVHSDGSWSRKPYNKDYHEIAVKKLATAYHYNLTLEQKNALKYAHGEGDDHHPTDRIILPLGTIVHCADIISARVWYDYGHKHDDWAE